MSESKLIPADLTQVEALVACAIRATLGTDERESTHWDDAEFAARVMLQTMPKRVRTALAGGAAPIQTVHPSNLPGYDDALREAEHVRMVLAGTAVALDGGPTDGCKWDSREAVNVFERALQIRAEHTSLRAEIARLERELAATLEERDRARNGVSDLRSYIDGLTADVNKLASLMAAAKSAIASASVGR